MNPRKLHIYQTCYRERQIVMADKMYEEARYMFYSFSLALTNFGLGLAGKRKRFEFEEEFKRPSEIRKKPKVLTEEDKQKQRELLMASLMVMRSNFELNNGVGEN